MSFKKLFFFLKEGILPTKCVICSKFNAWLCDEHENLASVKIQTDLKKNKYLDSHFAVADFKDKNVKKIIYYFKFKNFQGLGFLLADEILKKIPAEFFNHKILVPVPLHWTRKFSRGFNQADVLCFYLQKILKEKYSIEVQVHKNLKKIKYTPQQKFLSQDEREDNLANAFIYKPQKNNFSPKNQEIILVDDVFTTGTTLLFCAKILKKSGFKKVQGLTFARND